MTVSAVTLDDLDRDELLQLIRRHTSLLLHPADLVWARWMVACDRCEMFRKQAMELRDQLTTAMEDLSRDQGSYYEILLAPFDRKSERALRRARLAYEAAQKAYDRIYEEQKRLNRKGDRMSKLADQLYLLHEEMTR